MASFAPRLAITIGVPLLLTVLAERLLLPGIPMELADAVGGSHANISVFALGVMPILSAYWIVEVIAFLVPAWRSLRHGSPEGRATLERASRALALLLAVVQAWAAAGQMQDLIR